jgi:hypothetical protein
MAGMTGWIARRAVVRTGEQMHSASCTAPATTPASCSSAIGSFERQHGWNAGALSGADEPASTGRPRRHVAHRVHHYQR